MALFRSERGIGRGEVAESKIEAPFFAAFMIFCAFLLLYVHLRMADSRITMALAVSMVVFGATLIRVDLGVAILVVAMLLSPEIFTGHEYSGERPLNVRYDDVLILVIFVGVVVKQAFEGKQALWRSSPINAGIMAYFGICLVSTLLALRANLPAWDKRDAFFTMGKMTEFYMVYVLTGNALRTRDDIRRQLTLFFIVASIVCIYGLFSMRWEERIGAPFEAGGSEPNTLGGYLTIVITTAASLYAYAPTRKKRFLFMCIAILGVIPFLFTLSRASYIALIVSMVTVGILGRKPLILVAVVATLIMSPLLMPNEVKDRVNYTFQRGAGERLVIAGIDTGLQVDKSTHERVYVWRKVGYILHVAPWFGGGVSWESVMDSQYARVILETGLFGLAAFVFLQWRLLKNAYEARKWSRDWFMRAVGLAAIGCSIGMIVHALGTISFLIIRIMEPFWFVMALAAVVRSIALEQRMREYQRARVQSRAQAQAKATQTENENPLPQPSAPAVSPGMRGRPTQAPPPSRLRPMPPSPGF